MQVFSSSETPSSALYRIIRSYTKIFALFFGYLLIFLYLCIINQNIKSHVTKIKFGEAGRGLRSYRARPTLLPLHPSQVRLGEIKSPSSGRPSPRATCHPAPPHLPSIRSRQDLRLPRPSLARFCA